MKRTMNAMIAGTVAISMGCAQNQSPSSATTTVRMTGSGQQTSIASYKVKHPLLSFFMPAAVAMPAPSMTDSTGANVTLAKAWVVVKEIEFKTDEVEGAEETSDVEFEGPYFVDLLSSEPTSFGEAAIAPGVYRRVKMKLESAGTLPATAPSELQNNSIYLEGTVGGNQFSYSSQDGTEFKVSGAGGINISDGSNVLVAIKVADLFKMIDFSGVGAVAISESNRIPTGSSRCPLIDASANDLYTCIRKGLEEAGKLGKDDDGDHEIEDGEDEVHD